MITSSNFRGKKGKHYFSTHIFNLSPYEFTQISSGNTHWMHNLTPHLRSTNVAYFQWSLLHGKWEIHEKCDNHIFSCISHFPCSRVHRKYATWVLLGWGIKFCNQRVLLLEIWVKHLGDKLKIQVEKVVLLFYYYFYFFTPKMVNHPPWLRSSSWILLVLIKFILVVHFSYEANFRNQMFSNVCSVAMLMLLFFLHHF